MTRVIKAPPRVHPPAHHTRLHAGRARQRQVLLRGVRHDGQGPRQPASDWRRGHHQVPGDDAARHPALPVLPPRAPGCSVASATAAAPFVVVVMCVCGVTQRGGGTRGLGAAPHDVRYACPRARRWQRAARTRRALALPCATVTAHVPNEGQPRLMVPASCCVVVHWPCCVAPGHGVTDSVGLLACASGAPLPNVCAFHRCVALVAGA